MSRYDCQNKCVVSFHQNTVLNRPFLRLMASYSQTQSSGAHWDWILLHWIMNSRHHHTTAMYTICCCCYDYYNYYHYCCCCHYRTMPTKYNEYQLCRVWNQIWVVKGESRGTWDDQSSRTLWRPLIFQPHLHKQSQVVVVYRPKHWRKPVGLSDKAWIPPGPLHHVTVIQL